MNMSFVLFNIKWLFAVGPTGYLRGMQALYRIKHHRCFLCNTPIPRGALCAACLKQDEQ